MLEKISKFFRLFEGDYHDHDEHELSARMKFCYSMLIFFGAFLIVFFALFLLLRASAAVSETAVVIVLTIMLLFLGMAMFAYSLMAYINFTRTKMLLCLYEEIDEITGEDGYNEISNIEEGDGKEAEKLGTGAEAEGVRA